MKVGITTVHDSSNLGSYLQALGMQELVKQHGDQPYIIKTRSGFTTLCLYLGYNNSKSVHSVKSFVRFSLHAIRHLKQMKERYQKYQTYKRDWSQYENLVYVRQTNQIGLDCLLMGSDEIWNVNQPAFQNPLLYGIGIEAKRKCAYAISTGNATSEKFASFPQLVNAVREMDGILPRDENTRQVMETNGIVVQERICDPTIQVDIRKYMKSIEEVKLPKEDYIAVYSYGLDEKYIQMVRAFAERHRLKTVAVSLPQGWCDEYINCSPLEFGAVLSKANYVFTSTFHGTIFSALYHTKFVSLPAQPKVGDVLKLLRLEDHVLPANADMKLFCDMLEKEYCFNAMEERIKELRQQSFELYEKYMKQNI